MISPQELEKICLEQVITIAEAVEILTVSKKRVRDLCLSGKIIARQCGSTWLLSRSSVESRKAGYHEKLAKN